MTTSRRARRSRLTARQRRDLLRRLNRDARRLEREFAADLVAAFEGLGRMADEAAREVLG